MVRFLAFMAMGLALGCSWPPRAAAPPLAQNPAEEAEQRANRLPTERALERPTLPSVSPPVVLPTSRGGLL